MPEPAERRFMDLRALKIDSLGQIALVVSHPKQFEITIANIINTVIQAKLSMPDHTIAGMKCGGQISPPSQGSVKYEPELATLTASCTNVQKCKARVRLGEVAPSRFSWQLLEQPHK